MKSNETVIHVLVRNSVSIRWPYGFVAVLNDTNGNDIITRILTTLCDIYTPIWTTSEWQDIIVYDIKHNNCHMLI